MSTIADVARLAGVSPGTVSRVINGADNVRPDTQARVKEAISRLNYRPNLQARSLRSKRTYTLALAIPELANYFWTNVARGVQDACQAKGYNLFLCNTNRRPAEHLETLESMLSRVDGMILTRRSESVIVAQDEASSSAPSINSRRIPLVFIGQSGASRWNVDNVYSDSVSGSFALTEHLIQLGHQRIAVITGRPTSSSARDRVAGYCLALAAANLPIDPQLICWGEYQRKSAQDTTHQLLNGNPGVTGIVAANNEIAIGVMVALEQRQLRVPKDMALVCVDDFYPDSRFVSIMTVAAQLPYDLGINAAQLLLDRLNSDDYLRPRTVILPTRLIVRQSCGGGQPEPFNADNTFDRVKGQLIPSLPRQKLAELSAAIRPFVEFELPAHNSHLIAPDKSRIAYLKQVLQHDSPPQLPIPHIEYAITNKALYRYVLEREPICEFVYQQAQIVPADQIEFAQRTGIAAVLCRFPGQPRFVKPDGDWNPSSVTAAFDFPPLTDPLDFFDRYVRAAQNAAVGIAADFRSVVADTLAIAARLGLLFQDAHHQLESLAEELLRYQSKVVQLICDRFADDLAFVVFSDDLADEQGLCLPTELFETVFSPRLKQLIQPALEHGLPTVLYTPGKLDAVMPIIQALGFDGVYPAQPELNDLPALQAAVTGKLSILGGIPVSLLANGSETTIQKQVIDIYSRLAQGGGYAVGVSGEVSDSIPSTNFLALLRAVRMGQEQDTLVIRRDRRT